MTMLNKFFFPVLVLLAVSLMSFIPVNRPASNPVAPKGGDNLTVTNPGAGTAFMSWSFLQASSTYYIIIEDAVRHQVVHSGQTSQTSYTVSGLSAGNYRFSVSNGSIVIIDVMGL